MKTMMLILIFSVICFSGYAENNTEEIDRVYESEISSLKDRISFQQNRINYLENKVNNIEQMAGDVGIVLFFFAVFCALWAQNTNRSAWGWFFLGLFFHVFTALVLLYKNSQDNSLKRL